MTKSPPTVLIAFLMAAALLIHTPRPAAALAMAWRVESMVDAQSGAKTCQIISLGEDVTARLAQDAPDGDGVWSVLIGFDNQPGSLRYFRVNWKFFQTAEPSFEGDDASAIITLLKEPGEFVFEWIKGPNETKRGALFGVGDFAAKAALCEAWLSGTSI
ncbi:MAG: hypothetical protein VCD50_07380 [Alphaproteobacteria bacterium]